jgi:hypothetical protein
MEVKNVKNYVSLEKSTYTETVEKVDGCINMKPLLRIPIMYENFNFRCSVQIMN